MSLEKISSEEVSLEKILPEEMSRGKNSAAPLEIPPWPTAEPFLLFAEVHVENFEEGQLAYLQTLDTPPMNNPPPPFHFCPCGLT